MQSFGYSQLRLQRIKPELCIGCKHWDLWGLQCHGHADWTLCKEKTLFIRDEMDYRLFMVLKTGWFPILMCEALIGTLVYNIVRLFV